MSSTWHQDMLKRDIAAAGVVATSIHRGNENIVIRRGFANGKYTLLLTYSKAATPMDKINDIDANIVLHKTYTDVNKLNDWFQKIETINRMSLRKLQAMTNKNKVNVPSSKRYGSRLYWTADAQWESNGRRVQYFVLIGPKRGEGYRLHHYAGYLNAKGQLHHVREPASRPFAYTEKEALAAVAVSLKNGPAPKDLKTS